MNEIFNKIKIHFEKMNNKKFINNLFIILLGSIILLIIANIFLDKEANNPRYLLDENKIEYDGMEKEDYSLYLEDKLVNILSELKGVGKVNVMVTLESTVEKVTVNNTTKITESTLEEDAEGGTRKVEREDLTREVLTKGNDDSLLVVKEIKPNVQGVIVMAEGAEDPLIKETLYEAVKTVLGIKGNKVQIFSSKGD